MRIQDNLPWLRGATPNVVANLQKQLDRISIRMDKVEQRLEISGWPARARNPRRCGEAKENQRVLCRLSEDTTVSNEVEARITTRK